MMNTFIKKALSVFLATCTILPGSLCYAGKGKKTKKQQSKVKQNRKVDTEASDSAIVSGEEELRALLDEMHKLIDPAPVRCKLKLSESLKSKCIPIENSEHLKSLFADFVENSIKTDTSIKSMLDGTILFLSIINHFEKGSIPDSEKNLYWLVAFLTLDMCTIRDRGAYDAWYNRLLWQYKLPSLGDVKGKFDSKESEKWHRNLRVVASDIHKFGLVTRNLTDFFCSKIDTRLGAQLVAEVYKRLSPLIAACNSAEQAVYGLSAVQSRDLAAEAERKLGELKKEHDNPHGAPRALVQKTLANIERMRERLDSIQKPITLAQDELDLLPSAHTAITTMLSDISPASIALAEKTCDPVFKFVNESSESPILAVTRGLAKGSSDAFVSALKWAKDYVNLVKPCMDEADKRIQAHSKEFSEETFKAAKEAQEKCRQVLDACVPTISVTTNKIITLGVDALGNIVGMMAQGFKDAQTHWEENEEAIVGIQNAYEDKAISVVTAMLSEISEESVAAAKKAYEPFLKTGRQVEFFNATIKWAEYYLSSVKPCMEKADGFIQVLRGKFSEETLEAAKKAQKEFQQILSRYKPTSNDTDITQSFREIERHWNDNNITIHKIQEEQVHTAKKEQEQLEQQRMAEERAAAAESSKPSEIVLCTARAGGTWLTPKEFLDKNPQFREEWNSWRDEVMQGKIPSEVKHMKWHPDRPFFTNRSGKDLQPCLNEKGCPDLSKYKGGGKLRNTDEGFRIVYYKERTTNRIVVLYFGLPFGEGHGRKWPGLIITPDSIPESSTKKTN